MEEKRILYSNILHTFFTQIDYKENELIKKLWIYCINYCVSMNYNPKIPKDRCFWKVRIVLMF